MLPKAISVSLGNTLKERTSNVELIRIIAISMILILHFFIHAITSESLPNPYYGMIIPFFLSGVNMFFLISGWFQVKLSIRNVSKLVITILIFNIVNYILCYICGVRIEFKTLLFQILFPISRGPYWFISAYLGLLFTSPLVNIGLKSFNSHQLRLFIISFTLFILYSCSLGFNLCDFKGYAYMQALYMYCLGYYIRKYNIQERLSSKFCIMGYIIILAIGGLLYSRYAGFENYIQYNSIFIVSAAMLLFVFLIKLQFKSRFVNFLASGALGCYLLQDGLFGSKFLYSYLHNIYDSRSSSYILLFFAGIFISTWICSLVISIPVNNLASKISMQIDKSISRIRSALIIKFN